MMRNAFAEPSLQTDKNKMKKILALLLLLSGPTLHAKNNLAWSAAESKYWSVDIPQKNWLLTNGKPSLYSDGDRVFFTGDGGETVVLASELRPHAVTVVGSKDYTFNKPEASNARLSGYMELFKNGDCTLTINTSNDYTGISHLIGGTLVAGSDTALGSGTIQMEAGFEVGPTLDLNGHTLQNNVTLKKAIDTLDNVNATIRMGSINGTLTADSGAKLQLQQASINAGGTSVSSPGESKPGLLKELSVSKGLIAGIDRQTSLADGLRIQSSAELMIKSMTITPNNKIAVLGAPVTLQDVTIELSRMSYAQLGDTYYFDLSTLFDGSEDVTAAYMADVTFDASGLELPEGFDPAVNSIGFDFKDKVAIDKQTAKNLTLLAGDYMSQTMSIDSKGRPVFTALVPTPEPATGTLSLLALAVLAARRRRK